MLSEEKLVRICSRVETSPGKSIVGLLQQLGVCQHEKKTAAFTSMYDSCSSFHKLYGIEVCVLVYSRDACWRNRDIFIMFSNKAWFSSNWLCKLS